MLARFGLSRAQLLLLLFLATVLVTMAFLQNQPEVVERYDPNDTGSSGLAGLALWLDELGHPVDIGVARSGLPTSPGLLFVHPTDTGNLDYYSDVDVAMTYSWVERGGTLVLVGPHEVTALAGRFGVKQVDSFTDMALDVRQVQPLLPDVPTDWDAFLSSLSLDFDAEFQDTYQPSPIVPILAHTNGDPVVAIQPIGEGIVWHLTEDFALTNLNLRDERIASLLPAILRTVPAGAPAIISTHHLRSHNPSDQAQGMATLQDWLYTTPFGQATLLLLVASFAFLLLQGRRLGPAMPGPSATRPREAAEYVAAMAGLQRRMRRPQIVADHHRQRLKVAVGRLAQLPADLPDDEWLAQLQRTADLSPTLMAQVSELLSGYAKVNRAQNSDEAELIQLVQATDALLASLPRATLQLVR